MGRGQAAALGRRDAVLYLVAAALGSFGLGVASFYLNFLYRALGFDEFAIGLLAGAQAIGVVAGALPAAVFTRGRSRRAAILLGGTVTGVGIFGILVSSALFPLLGSAMLVGFGGIIASSSGAALLADATVAARRATRFGQQIALGTTAAFLSSVIAGALATPVSALLGARPDDALVLRALVASGGIIAAASIAPVLAIRAIPVGRHTLEAPTRNDLVRRFIIIEVLAASCRWRYPTRSDPSEPTASMVLYRSTQSFRGPGFTRTSLCQVCPSSSDHVTTASFALSFRNRPSSHPT